MFVPTVLWVGNNEARNSAAACPVMVRVQAAASGVAVAAALLAQLLAHPSLSLALLARQSHHSISP